MKELWSGVRRGSAKRVQFAAGSELVGEPEIRDFDIHVGVEKQVFRLQIAVNDALLMQVFNREHDLTELGASLFLFHSGGGKRLVKRWEEIGEAVERE